MNVTKDFLKKLSACPIFANASAGTLKLALSGEDCEIRVFNSGNILVAPGQKDVALALILRGKAEVFSSDPGKDVLIHTLSAGDCFGVSGLFNQEPGFSTRVVSKGGTRVLMIPQTALSVLLENDTIIMYNYIRFMAERIRFLNEKILYYTAGSTERRLALYLTSFNKKTLRLTISMTDLANMLDVGRASLYRAFDKLSADGYIIRSEKIILIMNRDELLSHYQ